MGYYQGDFYAGSQGDPFWGGLLRIGAMGLSAIRRGRKAVSAIMPSSGVPLAASGTIATAASAGMAIMKRGGQMIMKHPVLSAAGAAGALGTVGVLARPGRPMAPAMGFGGQLPMKGFHISRRTGAVVRNRRMNVANGRALSRAVRRLTHFARKYRKVVGFVSPKKPKGRMYFKKKRAAR